MESRVRARDRRVSTEVAGRKSVAVPRRSRALALVAGVWLALASEAAAAQGWRHMVRRGDTLYRIAERYYGDPSRWVEIQRANPRIRPDALPEGAVLFIPRSGIRRGVEPVRPVSPARGLLARWSRSGLLRNGWRPEMLAGLALYAVPLLLLLLVFQTSAIWLGGKLFRVPEMDFRQALKTTFVSVGAYVVFAVFAVLLGLAFVVVGAPGRPVLSDLASKVLVLLARPAVGVALLSIIPATYAAVGFRSLQRTSGAPAGRAALVATMAMLLPGLALAILVRPLFTS